MPHVRLLEITDAETKAKISDVSPEKSSEMPDWAKALANNPEILNTFLEERKRTFSFSPESYQMIQLAVSSIENRTSCKALSIEKLRNLGWDDAKFVEFAMMVATIQRNGTLMSGLGLAG